jgi:transcriptional antiterminator RfaH
MFTNSESACAPLGPRSLIGSERWYVVYTQPHREATAQANLEAQGFHTFLPRYAKTIRHARKYRTTVAPLFLRYLFIAMNVERDRWRSVNGTRGVTALIMQHERPVPVRRGIVETLLASSAEGGEIRFCQDLKAGQRVRLVAGPFAEQLGVLEQLGNAGRIRILLEMMGSRIPIETLSRDVVPAN